MKGYDTTINILGSISDPNIIIESIRYYYQTKDLEKLKEKFTTGNIFGYDLSSSRKRIYSGIVNTYLKHEDAGSKEFFWEAISSYTPNRIKKSILYSETIKSNKLFHDIVKDFIIPKYFENRRLINTQETYEFLISISKGTKLENWSDNTLNMLGRKFISFMRKLGKFQKEKGFKHMIQFDYPDVKLFTYLIYLLSVQGLKDREIFDSFLLDSLLIEESEKIGLFKDCSMKGFIDFAMSANGNVQIELNYSPREVINVIFS